MYDEPLGFGTYNSLSNGAVPGFPEGVKKSTDKRGGLFAAELSTNAANPDLSGIQGASTLFPRDTISGLMVIGATNDPTFAVNQKPLSVNFYYKFSSPADDIGMAIIQSIHGASTVVGQAIVLLTPMAEYEYVPAEITYTDTLSVDKIVVIFSSSVGGLTPFGIPYADQIPGSKLLIDDMSITYDGTIDVDNQAANKVNILLFPNPASTQLTFACNGVQFMGNDVVVDIFDMTGRKVDSATLTSVIQTVDISALTQGMYVYSMRQGQNVLRTGKFSVTK